MASDIPCPLCTGPTEEHEAYRDLACPKCGLCAPPDVIERIRSLADASDRAVTIADEATGPHPVQTADEALTCIERGWFEMRLSVAAIEADLARLKQPAHVLAEAVEAWRRRCPCDCRECQGLCQAYAQLTGGRDGE
jgi:hypothetical protein